MSIIRTVIIGTDPLSQLLGREQASGFHHSALAMHPAFSSMGLIKATLGGQKQRQNAHAFARGLHLLVVVTNPGAHDLAGMPGGIIERLSNQARFP